MTVCAFCLSQDDLGELTRALAAAALPESDLQEPGRTFFRLDDEGGLIGYGGWEGRGADRLASIARRLALAPWAGAGTLGTGHD